MVTEITRDELKQKLDHLKQSVLLETLPAESYHHAHLPGALNIPPDQVRTLAAEVIPRKEMEVVVYCAGPTCHAAENAAREPTDLGYSNVRHYADGKQGWQDAGLPVMSDHKHRAA